tara:strand:+ start:3543 stop:5057 length:1515 start_codon:yes stop_codon:yes gene_type:complete
MKKISIIICLILSSFLNGNAQISKNSALYKTIYNHDSLLFEEGFNRCNLEIVNTLVTDDFEFYHDVNGTQDKAMFLKTFKESICSTPNRKPIRKLVKGSMEVFKLSNEGKLYAVIQRATHEFYIKEPNKELYKTNVALFTHLWIKQGENWKLKRSLSYNHQVPKKTYGPKFDANYDKVLFSSDVEIEQLIKQHNIPSLGIGYINDGQLQQVRLYGEKTKGNPVDYKTFYKIASLTKPIVAILTLKLVEQGLWSLDDPIYNYHIDKDVKDAPELKLLTTRHILSHQTGFPNWRYLNADNKLAFEFTPGSKFQYSGEGFEFLRKALEKKFNKDLEKLAEEHLFTPLGMNNTHFYWNDKIDEKDYAVPHNELGQPIPYKKYTTANAAANILTTILDYGQFMSHMINGAGLSDSLYQQFITPHSNKQPGIDWGLGCALQLNLNPTGAYAISHGGGDDGLKTIMLILPKSKQGLVIFSNSENGMVVWKKIIEEYFGSLGETFVKRNLSE